MSMDLKRYIAERLTLVEDALDRFLPGIDTYPARLHEAMRYSVLAPGKRIRPILVIAGAEAMGGDANLVMPTACALECLHTFTLVHDDLPCMDNADTRRGRPASHKVYGETLALLAGDALLGLTFQLIIENASTVSTERLFDVLKLVTAICSSGGLAAGQLTDMESEGKNISKETLYEMHSKKTGGLLTASVLSGAILAGATEEETVVFREYGDRLGMAFQIVDDILNVIGDHDKMGKPIGSDISSDKATFPKIYGIDEAKRLAQMEIQRAIDAIGHLSASADPLRAIARFVLERQM